MLLFYLLVEIFCPVGWSHNPVSRPRYLKRRNIIMISRARAKGKELSAQISPGPPPPPYPHFVISRKVFEGSGSGTYKTYPNFLISRNAFKEYPMFLISPEIGKQTPPFQEFLRKIFPRQTTKSGIRMWPVFMSSGGPGNFWQVRKVITLLNVLFNNLNFWIPLHRHDRR